MSGKFRKRDSSTGALSAFLMLAVLVLSLPAVASNLSDATQLREKCEKEIKVLEVPVRNFGDAADLEQYARAEKAVKLGKVKFIQSKFPEAIEQYNEYLKLQHSLYKSLARKYTAHTQKIVDDVAADLVDHVDNKQVEKYLRLAHQNLKDAQSAAGSPHTKNAIDLCRNAKNYAFGAYKLAGKTVPPQYSKDQADNANKVFGK